MPRTARKMSASGIYLVILRGVDRQLIFNSADDRLRFLYELAHSRMASGCKLLAYCLMGNHVHLLIKEGEGGISSTIQRIATRYATWYNTKYDRIGHLFQERFKSEPVEDDSYLLTVLRYIHMNPVKACACAHPEEFPYSSYRDYLIGEGITDTDYVNQIISIEELIRFTEASNEDECLEVSENGRRHFIDDDAKKIIFDITGCSSVEDFMALSQEEQSEAVPLLLEAGLSIRQTSRLTGLSVGIVRRMSA